MLPSFFYFLKALSVSVGGDRCAYFFTYIAKSKLDPRRNESCTLIKMCKCLDFHDSVSRWTLGLE
jgi:hypothetical protein